MFENTFHDFTGEGDRHWDHLFWKERNHEKKLYLKGLLYLKKIQLLVKKKNNILVTIILVMQNLKFNKKAKILE